MKDNVTSRLSFDSSPQIKGNGDSWVVGSIKQCKSELVKVHYSLKSVMRVPLSERLSKSIHKLFMPANLYQDLYLQLKADCDGFVSVMDVLHHPDLSYLRMESPEEQAACLNAFKNAAKHIHSVKFQEIDGVITSLRGKPLRELLFAQMEFQFTPQNLDKDASMRRLWVQACESHDGWVSLADMLEIPHIKALARPQLATIADFLRASTKLDIGYKENIGAYFVRPRDYDSAIASATSASEEEGASCIASSGTESFTPPHSKFFAPPSETASSFDESDEDDESADVEEELATPLDETLTFGEEVDTVGIKWISCA